MKNWQQAASDSMVTGLLGGAAAMASVALQGRRDSGSAIAPLNASSHVFWGEHAAQQERITWRHTGPGLAINVGAGVWWGLVLQKLFGAAVDRRGLPTAIMAGLATAALAYVVDFRLVPKRLTPGWEHRLSDRSVLLSLATMGAGLGIGARLARSR